MAYKHRGPPLGRPGVYSEVRCRTSHTAEAPRFQAHIVPLPSREALLQRAADRAVRLFEDEGTPEAKIIMRVPGRIEATPNHG